MKILMWYAACVAMSTGAYLVDHNQAAPCFVVGGFLVAHVIVAFIDEGVS